jgi:hypothetical protein
MTVRQSLGLQGYGDVTDDSADPDGDPDAEENRGLVPHCIRRHVVRPSEQVHDSAKKDRIEKLKARDYQIGQCQKARDPDVTAKKTENPTIDSKEPHLPVPAKTYHLRLLSACPALPGVRSASGKHQIGDCHTRGSGSETTQCHDAKMPRSLALAHVWTAQWGDTERARHTVQHLGDVTPGGRSESPHLGQA